MMQVHRLRRLPVLAVPFSCISHRINGVRAVAPASPAGLYKVRHIGRNVNGSVYRGGVIPSEEKLSRWLITSAGRPIAAATARSAAVATSWAR